MKLKRLKRSYYSESCAASDMAFLLIIYFMVIAGFAVNQGFVTTLPTPDSVRMVQKNELLRFDMDGAGLIFNEGIMIERAAAENQIRSAISIFPNLAVILSIDPAAPWQEVVSFVELAQKLEVDAFSFSMKAGL